MALLYLADTTTNKQRGVQDGGSAPSGTVDTGVMWNDSRDEWSGSAWALPTAIKEQDERDWRDAQLLDYDKRKQVSENQTDRSETPTDSVSTLNSWATELLDMPTLTGFPDTHTRPTAPA